MIRLISDTEKLVFTFQGAKLFYRRIPQNLQRDWVRNNTTKKGTDWTTIGKLAVEHAVLGWEGVTDAEGKPAEFSKELLDKLPGDMINEFAEVLLSGVRTEDAEKN